MVRRKLDWELGWKLAGIFVLGGLQGAMGWYMVQSGLVDDPRVSQYRLTAHLGLAFLIYGLMFWLALDVIGPRNDSSDPRLAGLRRFSAWLIGLIFAMVLTGGFVAGIRAGFAYNTFPLMNGHVVPPELFMLEPWWRNFFSNMATVQFDHRLLAWGLAFVALWFWLRSRREPLAASARLACNALLAALALQVGLGSPRCCLWCRFRSRPRTRPAPWCYSQPRSGLPMSYGAVDGRWFRTHSPRFAGSMHGILRSEAHAEP